MVSQTCGAFLLLLKFEYCPTLRIGLYYSRLIIIRGLSLKMLRDRCLVLLVFFHFLAHLNWLKFEFGHYKSGKIESSLSFVCI